MKNIIIIITLFLIVSCSSSNLQNYIQGVFLYKYISKTGDYRVTVEHTYATTGYCEFKTHEDCKVSDKETYESIPIQSYAWHNYKSVKTKEGTIIICK
jgi:hypothetical protein